MNTDELRRLGLIGDTELIAAAQWMNTRVMLTEEMNTPAWDSAEHIARPGEPTEVLIMEPDHARMFATIATRGAQGLEVALDLETLGTTPQSVVTQIGLSALLWRIDGDVLSSWAPPTIEIHINAAAQVKAGATMDVDTVLWWMGQDDLARYHMVGNQAAGGSAVSPWQAGEQISQTLSGWAAWLEPHTTKSGSDRSGAQRTQGSEPDFRTRMWGNGSDFDNAILEGFWRLSGAEASERPWHWHRHRCLRTLIDGIPGSKKRGWKIRDCAAQPSLPHSAGSDAITQRRALARAMHEAHAARVTGSSL